jgi:hypothetical protein
MLEDFDLLEMLEIYSYRIVQSNQAMVAGMLKYSIRSLSL